MPTTAPTPEIGAASADEMREYFGDLVQRANLVEVWKDTETGALILDVVRCCHLQADELARLRGELAELRADPRLLSFEAGMVPIADPYRGRALDRVG